MKVLRKEVSVFAQLMESRLQQFDARYNGKSWSDSEIHDLVNYIAKNGDSLAKAIQMWDDHRGPSTEKAARRAVQEAAADLANYAMMIVDNVAGLDGDLPAGVSHPQTEGSPTVILQLDPEPNEKNRLNPPEVSAIAQLLLDYDGGGRLRARHFTTAETILATIRGPQPEDKTPDAGVGGLRERLDEINVHEEADSYELRADGDYTPNDFEKSLLEDFGAGLMAKVYAALTPTGSVGEDDTGVREALAWPSGGLTNGPTARAPQPPKAETPAGVGVVDAMAGYLRVCASGGMPPELREQVEAAVKQADRLGYFATLSTAPAARPGDEVSGFVLVPREPTEAMKLAAFGPIMEGGRNGPITADRIRQEAALSVYRAMIAAASSANGGRAQDTVVEAVRQQLLDRSTLGIKKYGTPLDTAGLTVEQFLQHALEELMDGANYLQGTLMTMRGQLPPKE